MQVWAMIMAAGSGTRLQLANKNCAKQFLEYKGYPLFWHTAKTFACVPKIKGILFVLPAKYQPLTLHSPSNTGLGIANLPQTYLQNTPVEPLDSSEKSHDADLSLVELWTRELQQLSKGGALGLPWKVAIGGDERQDSVCNGLAALPANCDGVLVHDSARPFTSAKLILQVLEELENGQTAVIPGVAVTDTIKAVDSDGKVTQTFDRKLLRAVQTPQGFERVILQDAHRQAKLNGWQVTDDAALMELCNIPVKVLAGETTNIKITVEEDLSLLCPEQNQKVTRTGLGYDVHRYGGSRPFILGGVPIATDLTIEAHSDGDVVLHALIDALLGCICQGDIGTLFPDSDPKFAGISSGILLAEVLHKMEKAEFSLNHVDITIIAQVPRIAPHRENIAKNIAKLLSLPADCVNVKSTTEERLGFTGEKKGIKAMAVATGTKPKI